MPDGKQAPAAQPQNAGGGETVQLSQSEEREAQKRTGLRAAVVFESIRREGAQELERSSLSLAFSGLAAGLSMGFSLVFTGILHAYLPDAPWRPLVQNFGYTTGFLIVVLGRQQLFTENTVTPILPLLDDPNKGRTFLQVVRLWSIVLVANLVGAAIFAYVIAHASIFPNSVSAAFRELAIETVAPSFWTVVVRALFAGWLIALMVWLLPVADTQKLWVIIITTYMVGVGSFSHIIAGSVESLYGVAAGSITVANYFTGFLLPTFIGNTVGGILLVSLLNYGQVAPE